MNKKPVIRIAGIVLAGIAALCLVSTTVLYCISGGFMKQMYMEPWSKGYAAKYADPRVRLAASGLLAANNHNMQPWIIRLDPADPMVFYLYADSARLTREVDPDARQMMISQGTFLEYVAVAGEAEGWHADVDLFPEGTYDEANLVASMDQKPVAKITLTQAQAKSSNTLYDATFKPDTNRNAYKMDKLTETQVSALESLSTGGIAVKLYQDPGSLAQIGDYALQSAAVEAGVPRIMDESNAIFRANEYQKNQYRYGYSVEGQGASGLMKHILQGVLTVFPSFNSGKDAAKNFINYTKTSVENTPAYAMIVTAGNSRAEQVQSGMLYSRLVLTGHTQGLAMQPLSQVLEEYGEMKTLYTQFKELYAPEGGTVQMLFRVGAPTKSVPLSMRRDVQSLIAADR